MHHLLHNIEAMENNIDNQIEIKEPSSDTSDKSDKKIAVTEKLIASLVLGSLVAGAIGGVLGVKLFSSDLDNGLGGIFEEKTVVLNEESAVIDVAADTRPAIVSVVGTKKVTVSSAPNFPGSPDSFFFFFPPFNTTPQQPQTQEQEQQVSAGTGFFVDSSGLIATNKHVIADSKAQYTVYTNDGKQYDAQIVATDPVNDIALLKIEGSGFPSLTLGDSEKIKVGQKVIAIGNALGQFSNTVTTGVVSGINRSIVATGQTAEPSQIEGAIQTDAAINPGNSGGPLLDLSGKVLGINTAISLEGQLLGFAIPVNDLRKDIEVYKASGKIVKPFMGVRYIIITPGLKNEQSLPVEEGALITSGESNEPAIIPGSPAEKAGLKENDIILEINGQKITLEHSLAGAIKNLNPGDTISLKVLRDGKEININLTLAERT